MILPDLLFDLILFGALLLGIVLDTTIPALHGAASLAAVGAATYMAAQELCDALIRRGWWTQESLATSLSLSLGGFLYFWWRNDSDLALLGLSIGLMMASLMVAIAIIAAFGAAAKEHSARPLGGLVLTMAGSLALGLLAGLLVILLTMEARLEIKILVVGVSLAVWKLREAVRPPRRNLTHDAVPEMAPDAAQDDAPGTLQAPASALPDVPAHALNVHAAGRWALIPQRGTLLDRFLPVLLLGAALFLTIRQAGLSLRLPAATVPASADQPEQASGGGNQGPGATK